MVNQAQASSSGEHTVDTAASIPDMEAPEIPETSPATGLRPPAFKVRMTVSSGTYVRSIVHDIGLALGCGAHVVTLTRTRQGEFTLYPEAKDELVTAAVPDATSQVEEEMTEEEMMANAETGNKAQTKSSDGLLPPEVSGCIPWAVWEKALVERQKEIEHFNRLKEEAKENGTSDEEMRKEWSDKAIAAKRRDLPLKEWEKEVLKRFVSVPLPYHGWHREKYA